MDLNMQLQVGATRKLHVAQLAYHYVATPVVGVAGHCQSIVAGVTTVLHIHDIALEVIVKGAGGPVEGHGKRVQHNSITIRIIQLRQDCNFHSLDHTVIYHVSPFSKWAVTVHAPGTSDTVMK
jgi:hypothetical protein